MKIYYSVDFTSNDSFPQSIICKADSEQEAEEYFEQILQDFNLTFDGTIKEMHGSVMVL